MESPTILKRQVKEKRIILENLRRIPIIEIACNKSGVSRATFYRWKAADDNFKTQVDMTLNEGRGLVNDIAESQLINNIKQGNMTAIIFWLKNNNSRYSERQQLTETEIKRIVNLFNGHEGGDDVYQTLARLILERKMPITVARIINFFLTATTRAKKDENLKDRLEILSTVIKTSKVKS